MCSRITTAGTADPDTAGPKLGGPARRMSWPPFAVSVQAPSEQRPIYLQEPTRDS